MSPRRLTWSRILAPLLGGALLLGAVWVLQRELHALDFAAVGDAWRRVSGAQLIGAAGLTALSYLLFSGYERLAQAFIGRPLPYRRTLFAAFVAYAFNMNIGVSVLGGTAVRYRLYSRWGYSAGEVVTIVAICALTSVVGMLLVGGAALAFGQAPPRLGAVVRLDWVRPLGAAMLLAAACYLLACARVRRKWQIRGVLLQLPSPRLALAQFGLGAVDLTVAGAVLYVLHGGEAWPLLPFLAVYLLALSAGLLSHVPGGIGVFESVLLVALPVTPAGKPAVVATLVLFRVIYYLTPFVIAAALFGWHEWRQRTTGAAPAAAADPV